MATLALLIPQSARADTLIEAVPTNWRLQYYIGSNLSVYYTGSPCVDGRLIVPPTATDSEKDRFFSLIMTAKAVGAPIGVYWAMQSGECTVTSFYMKER